MSKQFRFLKRIGPAFLIGVTLLPVNCVVPPSRLPASYGSPELTAPDIFLVTFETTKGEFVVRAHRDWSPLGVDRFYDLVRRGLYDSIPIFRVVPNFVVQFGLSGDSAVDSAWDAHAIADEKVMVPNTRGRVAYARAGPRTRSTQLFIDLRDNSPRLDTLSSNGVTGYPPFGDVVKGMGVVDSFESRYGNTPAELQDSISILGLAWLNTRFPGLDYIIRTRVSNIQ